MQKTSKRTALATARSVILSANWFQFSPGERIRSPRVLSRMLLWAKEGKGRVRINGAWYPLETDMFLFLPWAREIVYLADAAHPFWVGAIHLIPDHPLRHPLKFAISHRKNDAWASCRWRRDVAWPGLDGIRGGVARPADPLRLLGTYIIERFLEKGLPGPALRSLAQLLVEETARAVAAGPALPPASDLVRRAQEFIDAHLNRPLSLADLAQCTGSSPSTVRRQFQKALGVPPYEWILQARMRRARRLLATTSLRIKQVAASVGFDDAFQFSRTFRQRTGQSPKLFREEQAFHPRRFRQEE